jgi:hypothetical protein
MYATDARIVHFFRVSVACLQRNKEGMKLPETMHALSLNSNLVKEAWESGGRHSKAMKVMGNKCDWL